MGLLHLVSARRAGVAGMGESVGGAARFDDLPGERQPVNNGRAQSRVGECLCPRGERLIGGDRDGRALFSLGENLKQQFRTAPVQLRIPELSSQESGAATLDFAESEVVAREKRGRLSVRNPSTIGSLDALYAAWLKTRSGSACRNSGPAWRRAAATAASPAPRVCVRRAPPRRSARGSAAAGSIARFCGDVTDAPPDDALVRKPNGWRRFVGKTEETLRKMTCDEDPLSSDAR
jgi:hypothetical protein